MHTQRYENRRARARAQALVTTSMRAHVLRFPLELRIKKMIYKYTHVAIYRVGSDMEGAS
jgi:hypothetical protein